MMVLWCEHLQIRMEQLKEVYMDMNSLARQLSLTLLSTVLSSCMVGPNYIKPKVVVSPEFKEAKGLHKDWRPIKPQDSEERGAWWKVFHDPVLNQLEDQLNRYNQNIAQSEANYRKALALVDQARAGLFPTLTGSASLFRQKQGGGTSSIVNTSGGTTSSSVTNSNITSIRTPTTTSYSAFFSASWELDLWGSVRRTIESNVATAQSDAALLSVTRLSAQSSLAQYYFELRIIDSNQDLLEQTVRANKKLLQLARHQFASGVVSRTDIVLAQTQVETAQSQAINNGILRAQYEHAIATLMGRPPAYLSLHKVPYRFNVPAIPVSVPSLLLERRPDIAQAERLIQSASASIGVTIATYYPTVTLTDSVTASAQSWIKLIHTPAIGWSSGLQLAQTFFDGGLRNANVRAAQETYIAQVAAYRQTVLTAFQEVEDNLTSTRLLAQQSIVQRQAAAHAQEAMQLMINQYKAGTVPFSNVINTQITAFNAQKTANDVTGLQMTAEVGLIKALGGGWDSGGLKNRTL
jgi:NodT family efflux transporter outer membrane factor (OMF) lipoprotein